MATKPITSSTNITSSNSKEEFEIVLPKKTFQSNLQMEVSTLKSASIRFKSKKMKLGSNLSQLI